MTREYARNEFADTLLKLGVNEKETDAKLSFRADSLAEGGTFPRLALPSL
jgi:hypothetical protein